MTIATIPKRSLFDVLIGEPLELIKDQPHQVLLSAGSVALMGSFAGSNNILDPAVGYCIAVGVEWAYLRGLATDSRAPTGWGTLLNWSAFGVVVLWGVLWCAKQLGGIHDTPDAAWWLALAHVVPIAWLALCSAQSHRAAVALEHAQVQQRETVAAARNQRNQDADDERLRRLQEQRDAIELEQQRQQAELVIAEQRTQVEQRTQWRATQLKQQVAPQPTATSAAQPIIYDDATYPSIQAAADAHGISRQAMSKRMKKGETK